MLGIGGLVLLIHLMGWSKRPQYRDVAAAEQALLTDYPHAQIKQTALADDRRAALFDLAEGVGFAAPFGDGRLTRVLGPDDITKVDEEANGLCLRLTDYTAPRLFMRLDSAEERAVWKTRLSNLGDDR